MSEVIDLKNQKTCIFGLQGSGKTQFAMAKYKEFKKPIVFCINDDDAKDWAKLPKVFIYKADYRQIKAEMDFFIRRCRDLAREGKIDCIIIDEADMFFQTNWDINDAMNDIVLNHRHMGKGVALWLISRRPQDIPTKICESSKHLIIYKLEGANALKKFDEIHPGIRPLIEQLNYEGYEFVYKQIGKEPKLCQPVEMRGKK